MEDRRSASCRCGAFQVECLGDPVRVSVCHCLDCQKRSGSAFAAQARWNDTAVKFAGPYNEWTHKAESGNRVVFRFCPTCGSTLAYCSEAAPEFTAIALGAFADPTFPSPSVSVYEERSHSWVTIDGPDVEHWD